MTRLAIGAIAGTLLALAGCGGHGRHTRALKDRARADLDTVRAATGYDAALQQFRSGALDHALASITGSLALDASAAAAHLLHARILFEQDRAHEASTALERAARLDPGDARIAYTRGIVAEHLGRSGEAVVHFRAACEGSPDEPAFRLAAAEALVEAGRLDDAAALLEGAGGNRAPHPGIRQMLGYVALLRGDLAAAIAHLEAAVVMGPADPVLLEDLARVLVLAGRAGAAEAVLRRLAAVAGDGSRRDLELMRAAALLELDRPVAARRILVDLTRAGDGPEFIEAWVALIEVAMLLGDDELMRRVADRLVASAPERHEGHLAMAMWCRRTGDRRAALEAVERAIARAGDDPAPRCFKAVLSLDAPPAPR